MGCASSEAATWGVETTTPVLGPCRGQRPGRTPAGARRGSSACASEAARSARFLIVSTRSSSDDQRLVANADGSGERLLERTSYPEYFSGDPSWSPRGDVIAVPLQRTSPKTRLGVVGLPIEGGDVTTDAHNLRRMPLDGGQPEQLTHFDSELIYAFDVWPDGKTLVIAGGTRASDVVLPESSR